MSDDTFDAKNELERKLLAALAEEISSDEFMTELMAAQVFIPVKDEDSPIKNLQRSIRAVPLVVEDEAGAKMLVTFTSPERAREFLAEIPGYGGGLLTEFTWILERIEPGIGILVNPGCAAGIDVEPAIITEMLERMAAESAKN